MRVFHDARLSTSRVFKTRDERRASERRASSADARLSAMLKDAHHLSRKTRISDVKEKLSCVWHTGIE